MSRFNHLGEHLNQLPSRLATPVTVTFTGPLRLRCLLPLDGHPLGQNINQWCKSSHVLHRPPPWWQWCCLPFQATRPGASTTWHLLMQLRHHSYTRHAKYKSVGWPPHVMTAGSGALTNRCSHASGVQICLVIRNLKNSLVTSSISRCHRISIQAPSLPPVTAGSPATACLKGTTEWRPATPRMSEIVETSQQQY